MIGLVITGRGPSTMPGPMMNPEQSAYKKLTELNITTYLLARHSQKGENLLHHNDDRPFIVEQPEINANGALYELMCAYRKFPLEDIFVLSDKMANIKTENLMELIGLWKENVSDIYILQKSGKSDPCCGIYTYHGLRQIHKLTAGDQRKKNDLQYYIQKLNTCHHHISSMAIAETQVVPTGEALAQ